MKDYKEPKNHTSEPDITKYTDNNSGTDRVAIIEERSYGLEARIHLLENAQKSIKITNYSLIPSDASDIFYGLILDAANRGVQVHLLFNGFIHDLYGPLNKTYLSLIHHQNVDLRFYEPLNLLKPWTLHNQLHDKIWLIDNQYALTGGRNIGDKYFLKNYPGSKVYDRDVLVVNTQPEQKIGALLAYDDYFARLWDHDYTRKSKVRTYHYLKNRGKEGERILLEKLAHARSEHASSFNRNIDWEIESYPTRKVSVITNPIGRLKTKPLILKTLNTLMLTAKDKILIQSPYVVVNEELQQLLGDDEIGADLHILTNSQYATPNLPAIAGMLKYKDQLVTDFNQVYGYQGDGSIHGKSYVIDDRLSLVGSFNLDPRSAFLNTENLVIIDSEPVAKHLTDNISFLMENSRTYSEDGDTLPQQVMEPKPVPWVKNIFIQIARILFYPFDKLL